jgi:glycosyltransferase involved in cell wall biosynthesis
MSVPCLSELPPPPDSRSGWPWTEASDPVLATRSDDNPWPKVSIVTPSYNQGEFIEETIRSVLLQGYFNLEYIVVDGGSDDQTVDILEKYDPWIDWWVSERDEGQTQAINKGIARATGEVFNWINSDDYLAKGALDRVASRFAESEDIDIVAGYDHRFQDGTGETVRQYRITLCDTPEESVLSHGFTQPSTFFRLPVLREIGALNEELDFIMDTELFIRYLLQRGQDRIVFDDSILAHYRLHPTSKTVAQSYEFRGEHEVILDSLRRLLEQRLSYRQTYNGLLSVNGSLSGISLGNLYGRFALREFAANADISRTERLSYLGRSVRNAPLVCIENARLIAGTLRRLALPQS